MSTIKQCVNCSFTQTSFTERAGKLFNDCQCKKKRWICWNCLGEIKDLKKNQGRCECKDYPGSNTVDGNQCRGLLALKVIQIPDHVQLNKKRYNAVAVDGKGKGVSASAKPIQEERGQYESKDYVYKKEPSAGGCLMCKHYEGKIDALNKDLHAIRSTSNKIRSLEEENECLQAQLINLQAKYDQRTQALKIDRQDSGEIQEREVQIKELATRLRVYKDEICKLEKKYKDEKQENVRLKKQYQVMDGQLNQKKIDEDTSEMNKWKDQYYALKDEHSVDKKSLETFQRKNEVLKGDLSRQEKKAKDYKQKYEDEKKYRDQVLNEKMVEEQTTLEQAQSWKNKYEELQYEVMHGQLNQLNEVISERNTWRDKYHEVKDEHHVHKESLEMSQHENKALKSELSRQEKKAKDLLQKYEDEKKEHDQLLNEKMVEVQTTLEQAQSWKNKYEKEKQFNASLKGQLKESSRQSKQSRSNTEQTQTAGIKKSQFQNVTYVIPTSLYDDERLLHVYREMEEMLSNQSVKASITSKLSHDITSSDHVLLPCVNSSRIGSDISAALQNSSLKPNMKPTLLIFNHLAPHNSKILTPSRDRITESHITTMCANIIDLVFWNGHLNKECEVNHEAAKALLKMSSE